MYADAFQSGRVASGAVDLILKSTRRARFDAFRMLTAVCGLLTVSSPILADQGGSEARPQRPNIVVIVADDMGWADVGYHGSAIPTPNLDRLARQGVELDQHYVAPMCTPTRAALLSGRYWSRFGNTGASNAQTFPFNTVTLAAALKEAGYETCLTGKWHLGSKLESGPGRFGFDHSYGALAGGVGPWDHRYKRGPFTQTWHRNHELIEEQGHVTDLITAEAVRFIRRERRTPFFLYVPFTAVHHPLDEPEPWLSQGKAAVPDRPQYAASAIHMDASVGAIIAALEATGRRDDTLLIFFSDNGGMIEAGDADVSRYPGGSPQGQALGRNEPLRGRKSQVYEGGVRTPAFVHWPAVLKPRKVETPLHVVDWMPTLCRLVGWTAKADLKWDGVDVWDLLANPSAATPDRVLYWKGVGGRSAAIRQGSWKLVVHDSDGEPRIELFNLTEDPTEQNNLAAQHPEIVDRLQDLLAAQQAKDDDAVVRE